MRRLNSPLWLNEADTDYPAVNDAVDVDVAVVGAGITVPCRPSPEARQTLLGAWFKRGVLR
jgi:hypothetical protein